MIDVAELLGFAATRFSSVTRNSGGAIVHPDDLRRYPAEVQALVERWDSTALSTGFCTRTDRIRWIREEAKVVRDVDGKPVEV